MNSLWTELTAQAGLTLTDRQHGQLVRYLDLLSAANEKMNLTRITDRAAAEVQHIGDAMTVLPYLPRQPHALVDVGSGGGVPGLPLAIVRPDARVMLIEATKKKAAFLREAAASLGLANVTITDARAEEIGQGEARETFDVAIARAVATLDWLAEWCLPLVKKGGKMLAMKGQKVTDELPAASRAIRLLGAEPATVHPVHLPGSEHRVIVEILKLGKTDKRYPRAATAAKGKPLH